MESKLALAMVAFLVFSSGCVTTGLTAPMYGCISYQLEAQEFAGGMSWAALLALLLVAVLMILAVGYMLSQFFHRQDWEALVKVEIYHTLIAASMIFITFWLSAFACSVAYSIAGGNTFAIADQYLYRTIYQDLIPSITALWQMSWNAQKMSAFMIGLMSCQNGVCFSPFAGYGMISYAVDTYAGILSPLTASLFMQKILLSFIQQFAFTYLLPIGFILKIIPFTRDAGAYVIAIALGLYVVFPLTYVFNKVVMDEIIQNFDDEFCSLDGADKVDEMFQAGPLCYPIAAIGRILPQAVFLPALNLVITISFMKSMARLFSRDYMLEFGE